MEINQAFIAAILTVIGYSLNDTVVVFDRIREFKNINKSWKFDKTVNVALNSTLSRTLNTSFTTLVVLISIFYFRWGIYSGFHVRINNRSNDWNLLFGVHCNSCYV